MTYVISTLVLVLIAIGLWKRRDVNIHVPVMLGAFALDVALVLWIEISRHAIEQAAEGAADPTHHGLLLFHVLVSLGTIVLYVVLTVLGVKIMRGKRTLLKLHRNLGGLFVVLRLTNYVTSFMVT